MSRTQHWPRPRRRLLLPLVTIALCAAMALLWLGWHALDQDRALEKQHVQERLDAAADLIGAALVASSLNKTNGWRDC